MKDPSSQFFVEKCRKCGYVNKIPKQDLYTKTLGAGIKVVKLDQRCLQCHHLLGVWTVREMPLTNKGTPCIEATFAAVRPLQVWKPTIFATPPRRHRV